MRQTKKQEIAAIKQRKEFVKAMNKSTSNTGQGVAAGEVKMSYLAMSVRIALVQLYPGFRKSLMR